MHMSSLSALSQCLCCAVFNAHGVTEWHCLTRCLCCVLLQCTIQRLECIMAVFVFCSDSVHKSLLAALMSQSV